MTLTTLITPEIVAHVITTLVVLLTIGIFNKVIKKLFNKNNLMYALGFTKNIAKNITPLEWIENLCIGIFICGATMVFFAMTVFFTCIYLQQTNQLSKQMSIQISIPQNVIQNQPTVVQSISETSESSNLSLILPSKPKIGNTLIMDMACSNPNHIEYPLGNLNDKSIEWILERNLLIGNVQYINYSHVVKSSDSDIYTQEFTLQCGDNSNLKKAKLLTADLMEISNVNPYPVETATPRISTDDIWNVSVYLDSGIAVGKWENDYHNYNYNLDK